MISGAGVVSAVGDRPEDLLRVVGSGPGERRTTPCGPIADFAPGRYLQRKGLRHLSRVSQLACAAAAQLAPSVSDVAPETVGVVLGSAWAGLDSIVRFEREAHTEGPRFVDPGLFAETVANVPAGHVSIAFGWSALNATVAAGSVSGLQAIVSARDLLAERRAQIVIAGGADSSAHVRAARGAGSEAACWIALELGEHRRARGARAAARLTGAATAWVDPRADGISARVALCEAVLAEGGVRASDVDLVLSCVAAVGRERETVRELFGGLPRHFVALGDALGETWAAAGPLATLVAAESVRGGAVRSALVLGECPSGHCAAVLLSSED